MRIFKMRYFLLAILFIKITMAQADFVANLEVTNCLPLPVSVYSTLGSWMNVGSQVLLEHNVYIPEGVSDKIVTIGYGDTERILLDITGLGFALKWYDSDLPTVHTFLYFGVRSCYE